MKKQKILEKIKSISFRKFRTLAPKIDKSRKFPKKITKLFNKSEIQQLLGYHQNKKNTLNPKEECEFYFYATKYCANIRNYFLVSLGMVGAAILKYGTNDQKKYFLKKTIGKGCISSLAMTEPNAGSNINEISTKYVKTNNGYIINGNKRWITLGGISEILLVLANGNDGLLLFIIDSNKKGIKKTEMKNILTNKGSHIANITFNKVKVSKSSLIGEKNSISKKALEYALMNGRTIAAISAFSMSSAALEEVVEYAKKREQFGKKIWQYQQIQKIIADARINIDAGIPIEKITSSTHSILVKKKKKNNYKINLKNSENIPNKDFTLNYSIKKGDEPKAALFTHRDNNNDYFLLMAVPPVTSVSKSEILKEVFFVVDVSGSMDGTSIDIQKENGNYEPVKTTQVETQIIF